MVIIENRGKHKKETKNYPNLLSPPNPTHTPQKVNLEVVTKSQGIKDIGYKIEL